MAEWVSTTSRSAGHLSGKAVIGGHEGGGTSHPLWVIRSYHNGDMIPGKLRIKDDMAHVSYDGREITVDNIEVLCAPQAKIRWQSASGGKVPSGAVKGGSTASGETLYVARAKHNMSMCPGKLHPSKGMCYIPFGGKEVGLSRYEVLCMD